MSRTVHAWPGSENQVAFIELLEEIDRQTPESVMATHLVCDNVSIHNGKLVQARFRARPRFEMHFPLG